MSLPDISGPSPIDWRDPPMGSVYGKLGRFTFKLIDRAGDDDLEGDDMRFHLIVWHSDPVPGGTVIIDMHHHDDDELKEIADAIGRSIKIAEKE